jgi:hypothetical protein
MRFPNRTFLEEANPGSEELSEQPDREQPSAEGEPAGRSEVKVSQGVVRLRHD